MDSVLAIDVGTKRVGVAIAERGVSIALPLGIFDRKEAEREILKLITERQITVAVFGLPLNDDDTEGALCAQVRNFAKRIQKRAVVHIVYVDEYGSSYDAEYAHHEALKSASRIDDTAAAVILQRYLDGAKTGRTENTKAHRSKRR